VSGHATSLLFNGLVKLNPDTLQPEGDLATGWQVAPDGKGYTFRLRPNVTFHDGKPCTADDVKFTYDLLLNERANPPRRAEVAAVLESVTVVNPTEVEFRLKGVYAPFLALHAVHGIVPRHLLGAADPGTIEQSDFSLLRPVGTGPFQFKEWQRGASLTLSRAPAYHAGQPFLDEVVLKTVASQEVVQTQLRIGEIDLATVPEAAADELRRQQNLTLAPVDSLSITYLGFQLDPARTTLFQDKRVRQALATALNREAILRIVRHGIGRLATGAVPPPLWAASDRLTGQVAYDPARAEQMLETAGWRKEADGIRARDGKRLAFELLTNRGGGGNRLREQYAQMIQDDWRKIGVEARPVLVDFQEVVNRLRRTREFDVYLTSYAFEADPDQRVLWSTDAYRAGFNASRYSNPALDQLLTEAVQTLAQERRRDLYLKAQEILLDDMPAVVLDYPRTVHVVAKRLRNVVPNVASLSYNAHQWWLAEGP
jgi:peptide/nickel transport system substrate-binding protein